jgi:hypothetical protein
MTMYIANDDSSILWTLGENIEHGYDGDAESMWLFRIFGLLSYADLQYLTIAAIDRGIIRTHILL